MNILNLIVAILPSLISLAEKIFINRPKSGADKKALVIQGTEIALTAVGALSKGGQAKTWEKLNPLVSQMIDICATVAFPSESAIDKISPIDTQIM